MDFQYAKQIFADYVKQYDRSDDKIRLKIVHTYGVVSCAEYIAAHLNLPATDRELAKHIALLHDIGRFKQLMLTHSFDDTILNHTRCSLEILFGEAYQPNSGQDSNSGMIRSFVKESLYDPIIYEAIKNHGAYLLHRGLKGKSLLHARLIRDADKLDNYRVKTEDDVVTMVGVDPLQLGSEPISDQIYEDALAHRPIQNKDRITHMDMWVSYLAYLYDLNYPASLNYLKERHCVEALVNRIPYKNKQTALRMNCICHSALEFIDSQLEKEAAQNHGNM